MTRSDFVEWKRHPITQEIFSQLAARAKEYSETIVASVHDADVRELSRKAGIVEAFNFLLNIEYEESHGD